jgi:hypothetical protein
MGLTSNVEKEKSPDNGKKLEKIIDEHPEKKYDKNEYQGVLDVLLDKQQEEQFVR